MILVVLLSSSKFETPASTNPESISLNGSISYMKFEQPNKSYSVPVLEVTFFNK